MKDFLGYDEADGSFYYTSNEESPLRKAVYKIDKKGKKTKLSQREGTNTPLFSKSMKYYMNKFSNLDTPMLVTLNDNTGKTLKTLITNDQLKTNVSRLCHPAKRVLYLPDYGRGNFEWMDDEACQLLRIQEISGADVPI